MSEKNKNDGFLVPVSKITAVSTIREQITPAPERGRNNEIILEEELYLKNLEKVINKQFFPLLHQKDLNEEPQEFDTSTVLSGAIQNDVDKLTVNQYMAKYNSEDNKAFEKLMDKDDETWQKKYWWIAKQAEDYREKQLAIQAASDSKNIMIENKKEQVLMLENGDGQNNFIFMPTTKSKQIKTYSDPESSEFKKISYDNTRFDDKTLLQLNERPDSRQSTSQPALAVDRLRTQNILGIEEKPSQYTHISYNRPREPEKPDRIQGYNLLTMPSPSPNNQTPMMTWGEVEGTPLNIGRDRADRGFRIQESSKRDKLVENMPLEHARKKKMNQDQQKQKMKDMLTPTPMRRESSILRNTSSILTPSKKISKDHSQMVSRKSSVLTQPKVPPSSFSKNNKSVSNKGLPDNLLHFD